MSGEVRGALLEVGCAEIPAAYLPDAIDQMRALAAGQLREARLRFEAVDSWATPRRLVLAISGVPPRGEDSVREVRGPSAEIAYDDEGNPTPAAEGFARGQSVATQDLQRRTEDRGTYVYAVHRIPGRDAVDILAEVMSGVMTRLAFPRTMRWGVGEYSFVRPVRWLVALWGDSLIPLEFAGLRAGRQSRGPRYDPIRLTVERAEDYVSVLEAGGVMVDPEQRRRAIVRDCLEAARSLGGRALLKESVLDEVTYLVEHPVAVAGSIPRQYMDVPRIVVVTAMQSHLRFFPVEGEDGDLMPHFLSVINGTEQMRESVVRGNELVLNARLADARFFWDEDRKQSLEQYAGGLEDVVFHERLGSLADKVRRLGAMAERTAARGLIGPELPALQRAVGLCKADLLTQMVGEFPSLQGRIGAEYARAGGEEEEVCRAIEEHYLPTGSGDPLPRTQVGRLLSLIDKTDDLVGGFAASLEVSGSEDPYGLRRSATGILRLLGEIGHRVGDLLGDSAKTHALSEDDAGDVIPEVMEFLRRRLLRMLLDRGFRHEVAVGVLNRGWDDVRDVWVRCEAVSDFLDSPEADDLLVAWRRCHNLGQEASGLEDLAPDEFATAEARDLCRAYLDLKRRGDPLLEGAEYGRFFSLAAGLRPRVDAFLDSVRVMVSRDEVRRRRLALLSEIASYLARPVDWSVLPG
ncbi:MAG: glycine--tRNA ligase subunit beta [Bacillota bacterium]